MSRSVMSAGLLVAACLASPAALVKAAGPNRAQVMEWFDEANKLAGEADFNKATALSKRILDEVPRLFGKGSEEHASVMNNLASLHAATGRYAEAEPLLKRSLAISEDKLGKDHPSTASSLNNLAELYRLTGRYIEAEPLYKRSLAIREAKLGKDHAHTAQVLNDLALMYKDAGRYPEAEPLYQRSLAIREAKFGKAHAHTAQSLNNLAGLYKATGRHAEAEPLYKRSLAIYEAKLGNDHPETAQALNNLAVLYRATGRHAEAEPLYKRSLAIREAKLGRDHPGTAQSLGNLAMLYDATGRPSEAEPLYKRALAIYEAKLGKDHPETARTLNNLALLYQVTRRYADAEPLLNRSVKINEAVLGKDHPDTAGAVSNLALLYQATGRNAEGESFAQRALDVRRARLGRGHPDTTRSQFQLATLRSLAGRHAEAVRMTHLALQLDRAYQAKFLPALSDGDQLSYLNEHARLDEALTVALSAPLNEENAARSAAWLVNGKAVAHQAVAERTLIARAATSGEARKQVTELASVRQQLASLVLSPGQYDPADVQQRQRKLAEKERLLSAELHLLDQRSARDDPWIELDELARRLPAQGVYVDYVRHTPVDLKTFEQKPARYAAWVTTPRAGVRVVDLGPADPVDAAVAAARKALDQSAAVIKSKGEPKAEAAVRRPLQALADLVLKPLREDLDAADGWVICPDSALWLVPWAALPLDENTYAVEKHPIRLVVSGRDLVLDPLRLDFKPGPPVIVADPDFDLRLGEANRAARELPKGPPERRALLDGLRLGKVPRLPGTATEAEAITEALTAAHGKPTVLTDKDALTAGVRAAKSPGVLVLATHGFFLPEPEARGKARAPENPLLRCGLLFAGCNHAREATDGQDTGVLTGMDVVGLDLRGTKLVVLSACETGLGDVRNGEGVAGLRQAFMLAGAESVLASLWKVPDLDTALLMSAYWDAPAGRDRAESLRQAQLKRIAERRDKFGAAHPYFWAAFTLTGR